MDVFLKQFCFIRMVSPVLSWHAVLEQTIICGSLGLDFHAVDSDSPIEVLCYVQLLIPDCRLLIFGIFGNMELCMALTVNMAQRVVLHQIQQWSVRFQQSPNSFLSISRHCMQYILDTLTQVWASMPQMLFNRPVLRALGKLVYQARAPYSPDSVQGTHNFSPQIFINR